MKDTSGSPRSPRHQSLIQSIAAGRSAARSSGGGAIGREAAARRAQSRAGFARRRARDSCPRPAGGQRPGSDDARREGQAVPLALSRTRGRLPDAVREQEDREARLRARVPQQVRPGRLRAAEGEVRRVPEPGVHSRSTTARCSMHLTGRHVMGVYPLLDDETCWFLAVDFDKTHLDRGRERVRRDLPQRRPARRRRAIALGQRCPRLVLLLRAGAGEHRAQDGLLPHHRNDVAAARAEHGFVRSAVPEPGHDAARRLRKPDRAAASARGHGSRGTRSSSTISSSRFPMTSSGRTSRRCRASIPTPSS